MLELRSWSKSRLSQLTLASLCVWSSVVACGGSKFEGGDVTCRDGACISGSRAGSGHEAAGAKAGSSSGGAGAAVREPNEGGSDSGAPAPVGGTGSGVGGSGSSHGGSTGLSTSAGQGGEPSNDDGPLAFPATKVLDDFNRLGIGIGLTWAGAVQNYSLRQQALWCELCGNAALWSAEFAAEQEVFATYARFDADAMEINLVLKAQLGSECELIEVLYAPEEKTARVAYCTGGKWSDSDKVSLELHPGDEFGGRAHADGTVELFVNGESLVKVDASGYPHQSGHIGVNGLSGPSGNAWDDFGGGEWAKP